MSHHDLRPGQVLGDRYRLDRALGSGRIGTVYAAEDLLLARPVAVKVIDPEFADGPEASAAIRRAGSLMASTSHAGLVTVYDATQLGDHFCIVMEFVAGPNLASLIEDGGVSAQLAARIGHQAATALKKIHDLGHVHGSVRASNILVTPHGSAKLADLGLGLSDETADDEDDAAGADVRHLATALRRSVARPSAKDAADLVDVLDAAARSNGQRWNAAQLADALGVLAGNGDPGAIPAGTADPDATAVLDAVPSGPAYPADVEATQILPAPGVGAVPATHEMIAGTDLDDDQDVQASSGVQRRPRGAWLGGAALAVAVLALVAVMVSRDSPDGGGGGTGGAEGGQPVAIQGASDFDPLGGGGEHSDEVPAAYDGDPATAWTTEGYEQPNLGGIKSGVGIWFDLGDAVDVGRIDVTMAVAGTDYALYALDTAPEGGDPAAWGEPVATATQAGPSQAIDVPDGKQARYWLVWLTNLGRDDGRFRGGVAEIAFVAR